MFDISESPEWNKILNILADPSISEIASNGKDSFFIVKDGDRIKIDPKFSSDDEYIEEIQRGLIPLVRTTREFNMNSYLFEGRLSYMAGGTEVIARCHIGLPPSTVVPQISIAKKSASLRSLDSIAAQGSMSTEMKNFLEMSVKAGLTVVLSGGTGAGKQVHKNTEIPTPSGMRKVDDLNIGDTIFDETGKKTKILNKYSPNDPQHYRLTFNDGTTVDAGMGHLWKVFMLNEKEHFGHKAQRILTDDQINNLNNILKDSEGFITFSELKKFMGGNVSKAVRDTVKGFGTEAIDFFSFDKNSVIEKIENSVINKADKKNILERFEFVEESSLSLRKIKELVANRYFVSRILPDEHRISKEMVFVKKEVATHLLKDNSLRIEARENLDKAKQNMIRPVKLMTTQELVDYGVVNHKGRLNFAIESLQEPVQYNEQSLPIDPYTLGAWLGDGYSASGNICGVDHEVINKISSDGFNYKKKQAFEEWRKVPLNIWNIDGLAQLLRENNLKNNKHIPEIYKYSSVEQRIELLSGLLDTDGSLDYRRGTVNIELTTENIVKDMKEIVSSLGWKSTPLTSRARSYKAADGTKVECKDSYSFSFVPDRQVFNVSRKAEKLQERLDNDEISQQSRRNRHYIQNIELIPDAKSEDYYCFEVDSPTHMFLCSDSFIPTHNTTMLESMTKLFPNDYRIAVAEDIPELVLTQPNVTYWEAVPFVPGMNPNEVATLQWVVKQFQRNRNDRIIVGETRGAEFSEFLVAANSGKNGSLTTIHADDPVSCLRKMTNFATQGFPGLNIRSVNTELASAVNIIVQLNKFPDTGRHRVTQIQEITQTLSNNESASISTQPLYTYDPISDTFAKTENMTDALRKLCQQREIDISEFLKSRIGVPVPGHQGSGESGRGFIQPSGPRTISSPLDEEKPPEKENKRPGLRLPTSNPFNKDR